MSAPRLAAALARADAALGRIEAMLGAIEARCEKDAALREDVRSVLSDLDQLIAEREEAS